MSIYNDYEAIAGDPENRPDLSAIDRDALEERIEELEGHVLDLHGRLANNGRDQQELEGTIRDLSTALSQIRTEVVLWIDAEAPTP